MSITRPNILLIVADQLAPHFLPVHGHRVTKTPHLDRIAERGTVFDAAYTSSPLCVPGRAGLFTGRLPSRVGVYDSAGDLRSTDPTIGHLARRAGYHTVIAGKCHFIGVDQMHGFEDRTTSDICPAEPIWFSHWDRDGERPLPWYHTFDNVKDSGQAERSTQQDHDDGVAFTARQWLYDWRRREGVGGTSERRPFFMHMSFTHPHDPYVTPRRYWERFRHDDIDPPITPYQAYSDRDPFGQWLYRHYDRGEIEVTEEHIRRARHAYYANIALVDDHVGSVLDTLEGMGELENTAIIFTADHGEMLGERGQWYKMSPFERSARVPMIVSLPGTDQRGRCATVTGTVDLLATVNAIATDGASPVEIPTDGTDLTPLCVGDPSGHPDTAVVELFFEGLTEPACVLRQGRHKLIRINLEARLLYDIVADPEETTDLATDPAHAATLTMLESALRERYDFEALRAEIVESQTRRAVVTDALLKGTVRSWAYQPITDAAQQYYRVTKTWHEQEEADFLRFDR